MPSDFEEISLSAARTVPIAERGSKVRLSDYGVPVKGGKSFRKWMDSLPDQLAVKNLKSLVLAMRRARSARNREIILMMGAHVIKCGLPPYLIEMMKKGYITTLAVNGASAIHDLEMAFFGETSEDVPANLEKGIFGFAAETADRLFEAVSAGREKEMGLGEAVGRYIRDSNAPNKSASLLGEASRLGLPVTVHVAIGTDILAQHKGFDGAAWGEMSHRDFRILAKRVENLGINGGVVLNVGSAVILPEVFIKAVSVARNLGASFNSITACNIDMIQHYRPAENVLRRPSAFGGTAISITGHHELMIPLLYSSLMS